MVTLRHPSAAGRFFVVLAIVGTWLGSGSRPAHLAAPQRVIIQGADLPQMTAQVLAHGGTVTGRLASIKALTALLPPAEIAALGHVGLQISLDEIASSADDVRVPVINEPETLPPPTLLYPALAVGAKALHDRGITGEGIGVAILDSGMPPLNQPWTQVNGNTLRYTQGARRMIYKDLVTNVPITDSSDPYGHGTHVLGTLADGRNVGGGARFGVAPGTDLAVVRVLDAQGQAPYSRVIAGIDWVIENHEQYNIRVLNLSLQAPIHGPYWHDPLAQAVMAAWEAGITVVVAAGNQGPTPATITVPGNVPYVITVGSIKPGIYAENGIDQLASYSSAGPTESKFIKPDILAPGSRVIAPMPESSALTPNAGLVREKAKLKIGSAQSKDDLNYYYLSGTSMAAAEVSGLVALLLDDEPNLTNNQVKQRLLNNADKAVNATGTPAYSIWQQGAGRVNASAAIDSTSTAAANAGLAIGPDRDYLQGTHYLGTTNFDPATQSFYLQGYPVGGGGYSAWAGGYSAWAGGYSAWAGGYSAWAGGYSAWAGGYSAWAGGYSAWAGGYSAWAGSTSVWSSAYPSHSGNLVIEPQSVIQPVLEP